VALPAAAQRGIPCVTVARSSSSRKLAQGSGSFFNSFPGVPCTGGPETRELVVTSFTSFAFKQGRASAPSVTFTVFNPQTGSLVTETAGPIALRIRKK
jgi:hypothetical protein